ncbi:TPA: tandem-95 repeat protein [Pseudomonas aeruginosa]|nr:tandem-95 repeat protein [Pseudomonas aeruginosa]HCE8129698.1 tandem-95 repeat protein [Pseudomonas aeruginosa]HCF0447847.1 tandem-95 repeat protein [Pseudomonas aeruginosa]
MTTSLARLKRAAIHAACVILSVGSIFGVHLETVEAAQQCRYDVYNYGMPACGIYVWDGKVTDFRPVNESTNGDYTAWSANGFSSGGQSTYTALQDIMGSEMWATGIKGPTHSYAGPSYCDTKAQAYIAAQRAQAGSNWNGVAAAIIYGMVVSAATQICGNSNNPPTASNVAMGVNEDTTGTVALSGWDAETPWSLSYSIVNGPANGSAYIVGNTLVFTPNANWSGSTSLTYAVTDPEGLTAYATVFITVYPVNDAPVVTNRTLTTAEDTPANLGLTASDVDSTVFTYEVVGQPANGSATISGSTLTFTPAKDWNGTTSLTYRVRDDAGAYSNVATVTITVTAVNDPPVAIAKSLTIDEDTPGSVTLQATDVDSPVPTVFQVVTAPNAAQGSASISGSTLTFTPAKDWNGSTSLTYRAQDTAGAWSAPATVTIVVRPVNDPPVVIDRTLILDEDTVGNLTLTAADVDSTVFTFEVVSGPSVGTVKLTGAALSFTPPADWNGSTTLTYRVKDDAGAWSNVATVRITVNAVNDIPVVQPVNLATDEDTQVSVTLAATDIDSAPSFVFELLNPMPASEGKVTLQGNVLTFTPALDWNGATGVDYRARDTEGAWSNPARISITVRSVNDKPVKLVPIAIKTLESKSTTVSSKVQYYP